MFSRAEIKRNLLGCLDIFLLMPSAPKRFGTSFDEAMRSFIIPILLFPATLAVVYLFQNDGLTLQSQNTIALLYSLRLALTWALFLGCVYWITAEIDRKEHFWQFVIANNWLSIPATLAFLPVAWFLFKGVYSWQELYPVILTTIFYSYLLTAVMATYVLRIPWELAGFITMIGLLIDDYTTQIVETIIRVS